MAVKGRSVIRENGEVSDGTATTRLVAIEGASGVGKSVLAGRLAARLDAVVVHYPAEFRTFP